MEIPELEQAKGSPAWMATFGDLMSLLLCFFVLLFSFSQIDALKFKQIAGSMKVAFGVQNEVIAEQIPMGTSAVLDKFSPGKPEPTPFDEVKQQSTELFQQAINVRAGETDTAGGTDRSRDAEQSAMVFEQSEQAFNTANKRIEELLEQHIRDGAMELEDKGQQLIIRLKEGGAFPAGSANLQPQFSPILRDVANALADVPGAISISGHTDNSTVSNELFRNNWELSAQRAVAVASEIEKAKQLDARRLSVMAFADKKPLVANTSAANRKVNRRVEIAITHGSPVQLDPVSLTQGTQ